jgi:hypothetical protein
VLPLLLTPPPGKKFTSNRTQDKQKIKRVISRPSFSDITGNFNKGHLAWNNRSVQPLDQLIG